MVGDRMWEEMGMLVPCTAAGSWLTLRRTIPEGAGGPEGSSEELGGGLLVVGQPPPHINTPRVFICAAAGPIFVPLEELPPVTPEVRVPSNY